MKQKKYFVLRNKDAANAYVEALDAAGFVRVSDMNSADFMLFDYERGSGGKRASMEAFLNEKPGFIYPHTPLAYFLWDGVYPSLPVKCNFVHGEGAKRAMELYGYPYRVEACGFGRCEVREFHPTQGKNLLFVPARTRKGGGYASEEYRLRTLDAFLWVMKNRAAFDTVTMCYANTLQAVGIAEYENEAREVGIRLIPTDPYNNPDPLAVMLKFIQQADLVISCETVGCVSVALGKPTLFYNAKTKATTLKGTAVNFEKYRHIYSFPLTLEEMSVNEILDLRIHLPAEVARWKDENIGRKFDAGKFVRIVKEYLS